MKKKLHTALTHIANTAYKIKIWWEREIIHRLDTWANYFLEDHN